jgi:hypothetical protein
MEFMSLSCHFPPFFMIHVTGRTPNLLSRALRTLIFLLEAVQARWRRCSPVPSCCLLLREPLMELAHELGRAL